MIQVVPTFLRFGRMLSRAYTRRVIIHHSASPDVSAAVIHGWHLAKGWSGIGYHYIIRSNGAIEAGRPLYTIGAHAGPDANHDSIGVCLTGNFMEQPPTDEQLQALVRLVDILEERYGTMLEVVRHRDVAATDCPGAHFPWPENNWPLESPRTSENAAGNTFIPWKNELLEEAAAQRIITGTHNPDDPAPKWFVLAVGLNIMKEMKEDGTEA